MTAIEPTHLLSNGRYAVALRAERRRREPTAARRDHALARRRAARRARLVLLRPLGPPAATGLADAAPGARPGRRTTTAASTPTGSPSARPGRSWRRRTTVLGRAPRTTSSSARSSLHNCGERTLDLELLSSLEVTLADPRADESHPAFSNLFVSAQWQAHHQAIVFARKPRLVTDKPAWSPPTSSPRPSRRTRSVRIQVDRQRWLGRNRDASHPLAALRRAAGRPKAPTARPSTPDSIRSPPSRCACRSRPTPRPALDLLHRRRRRRGDAARGDRQVPPGRQHRARFADVGDADRHPPARDAHQRRELRGDPDALDRALALARAHALRAARSERRLRPAPALALRHLGRPADRAGLGRRRAGPRPAALAGAGASPLVVGRRGLRPGRRQPRAGVVPDAAAAAQIAALRDAHAAAVAAQPGSGATGFSPAARRASCTPTRSATLRALARVRFNADGRPLAHHVQDSRELHDRAVSRQRQDDVGCVAARPRRRGMRRERTAIAAAATSRRRRRIPLRRRRAVAAGAALGQRARQSGLRLRRSARPAAATAGRSTAASTCSRRGRTTPWPTRPANGSCCRTCARSRPGASTPSATGDAEAEYRVAPRPGLHRHQPPARRARHRASPGASTARARVKQVRVRLVNRGHRTLQLRLVGVAEWILGAQRSDRASTHTHFASVRAAPSSDDVLDAGEEPVEGRATVLFCTQRDRSAGFGGGTAFFALAGDSEEPADWTCDRRELFDARGRAVVPDHYGAGERLRPRPLRRLSTRLITLRAGDTMRPRLPARLRRRARPPRSRSAEQRGAGAAAAPAATRPLALGRAARRDRRAHARPAVRRAGQPLAALPDDRLPAVGARRLLPGRRRLRLSRPAAGRDGPRLGRAGAAAPADRPSGVAPVPRGRRAALVACADRRRRAHPFLRRPAVAAATPARTTSRPPAMPACSTTTVPFLEGAEIPRGRRGRLLRAGDQRRRRPASTSTARAPSTAACASARTACR